MLTCHIVPFLKKYSRWKVTLGAFSAAGDISYRFQVIITNSPPTGYVRNEGFRAWRERGVIRARQRYETEKIQEMDEKGLEFLDLDYSELLITEQDRENYDYLQVLLKYVFDTRNHYAHGSGMLHNRVLHSLEVVSELVN